MANRPNQEVRQALRELAARREKRLADLEQSTVDRRELLERAWLTGDRNVAQLTEHAGVHHMTLYKDLKALELTRDMPIRSVEELEEEE